ncbi:MAG: hypothetical protein HRU18_08835 [Pseudoalteromonas sp.]|uniref:hypothetical protein n=1 Tax=Pseudoalteromonas sp. TaxID=53249 RepID=UPI001DE44345|nr:hypothetical protein [Pseudoalteromonas sp.]NRA78303.1 hypothetical protein [Pseudoalteromonas sp.]
MEPIISYFDALSIEKVYFIALSVCLILSFKIKKVFHLALVTLSFNAVSQLFLFDYLFHRGVEAWVIGWCIYELLLIGAIIVLRMVTTNIHNKFILSDVLLIVGSVVQIFVYLLTYIVKSKGSSSMDLLYSATGPSLYVLTVVVLLFPFIYQVINYFKGYKEFNRDNSGSNRSSRGIFSARMRGFILGY